MIAADTNWWLAGPAIAATATGLFALLLSVNVQRSEINYRRADQARFVNLVIVQWSFGAGPTGSRVNALAYKVVNTSPRPVYKLRVSLLRWDWKRPTTPLGEHFFGNVAPNSETRIQNFTSQAEPPPIGPRVAALDPPFMLTFTDTAGVQWRRYYPNGDLAVLHRRQWYAPWRLIKD